MHNVEIIQCSTNFDASLPMSETSTMDINYLPPEMILKIFSYLNVKDLNKASITCKRWSQLAVDPHVWKKITIPVRFDAQRIIEIIEKFYLVKKIVFRGVVDWTWIPVLPQCTHLRKLEFDICRIDAFDMKLLVHQLPLIESVDVIGGFYKDVVDEIVRWPKLQSLNISVICEYFEESEAVRHLAEISPNRNPCLKKIGLSCDGLIDDDDFSAFSLAQGACVKSLNLDCYSFFSPSSYEALRRFTSLSTLRLFNTSFTTNEDLIYIRELKSLQELHISSKCRNHQSATSTGFEDLFKDADFPNLTAIYLRSCEINNTGLRYLTKCCANLKLLELRNCDRISNFGLQSIMINCKNLENLYLTGLKNIEPFVRNLPLFLQKLKRLYVDCFPKMLPIVKKKLQRVYPNIELCELPPNFPRRNEFKIEFA